MINTFTTLLETRDQDLGKSEAVIRPLEADEAFVLRGPLLKELQNVVRKESKVRVSSRTKRDIK